VINPDLHLAFSSNEAAFWRRLLCDGALEQCDNLEKLLVGCEIIAALDDLELLAA
jgi:hypothetical protein